MNNNHDLNDLLKEVESHCKRADAQIMDSARAQLIKLSEQLHERNRFIEMLKEQLNANLAPQVKVTPRAYLSRWTALRYGCVRDNLIYSRLDGTRFWRLWTPWLGCGTHWQALKIVKDCKLLDGGWRLPKNPHIYTGLLDYTKESPSLDQEMSIPGSWEIEKPGAWCEQSDPSDTSYAFAINFHSKVIRTYPLHINWLIRGCKEMPVYSTL